MDVASQALLLQKGPIGPSDGDTPRCFRELCGLWGLGFRVFWDLGAQGGLGFRVQALGFGVGMFPLILIVFNSDYNRGY